MSNATRNTVIDSFRIFAIFGVVSMHVQTSSVLAQSIGNMFSPIAVPFFFMVSLYLFNVGFKNNKNINQTFQRISVRLLLPYLMWSFIYIFLRIIKTQISGVENDMNIWKALFYGSSAVQLYFIPNLLIMQVLSVSMHLFCQKNKKEFMYGVILLLCSLLYLYIGVYSNCFGMSPKSFITIPIYVIIGFLLCRIELTNSTKKTLLLIGLFILLFIITINIFSNRLLFMNNPLLSPLSGLGCLFFAIGLNNTIKLPNWITSCSYGIYLSHIIFLESFELALKFLHIDLFYGFIQKIVVIIFIMTLSVGFVHIMRKLKWTSLLLLGEKKH